MHEELKEEFSETRQALQKQIVELEDRINQGDTQNKGLLDTGSQLQNTVEQLNATVKVWNSCTWAHFQCRIDQKKSVVDMLAQFSFCKKHCSCMFIFWLHYEFCLFEIRLPMILQDLEMKISALESALAEERTANGELKNINKKQNKRNAMMDADLKTFKEQHLTVKNKVCFMFHNQ